MPEIKEELRKGWGHVKGTMAGVNTEIILATKVIDIVLDYKPMYKISIYWYKRLNEWVKNRSDKLPYRRISNNI